MRAAPIFMLALFSLSSPAAAQSDDVYQPPAPIHVPQAHFPVTPVPPIAIIPPLTNLGAATAARIAAQDANDATTQQVTDLIARGVRFCNALQQDAYKIDCLAYAYWEVAQDLPTTGDYGTVRQTLETTADRLTQIARANRAPDLPVSKARRGGNDPKTTSRALTPVTPARLPQATAQASAVIQEAQTTLLRATGNSDRRRAQYQKISTAMETGTVLLRAI